MNKSALSFLLDVLVIGLICFSVFCAFKSDREMASYLLIWALVVHVVVKAYLA